MARRWWWRLAAGALSFGVLQTVFTLVRFEPDPVRLGLLVALVMTTLGLLLDSLGDSGPSWDVVPVRTSGAQGQDPRTARYLSLLEAHATSRTPDAALRDRFATMVDLVLLQRHGLQRGDPAAPPLLGADLVRLLDAPPRRLSGAEIDHHLTTIEEL